MKKITIFITVLLLITSFSAVSVMVYLKCEADKVPVDIDPNPDIDPVLDLTDTLFDKSGILSPLFSNRLQIYEALEPYIYNMDGAKLVYVSSDISLDKNIIITNNIFKYLSKFGYELVIENYVGVSQRIITDLKIDGYANIVIYAKDRQILSYYVFDDVTNDCFTDFQAWIDDLDPFVVG
jgi:hypothetical protein